MGREKMRNNDLKDRLLDFAVNILRFLSTVPFKKEYDVLKYQLSRSATAIGANYEESQSSSYKEFIQKSRIALREANESKYWLKIIRRMNLGDTVCCEKLLREANELSLIFGSIVSKSDRKLKAGYHH
jgi:four helix bundle protein